MKTAWSFWFGLYCLSTLTGCTQTAENDPRSEMLEFGQRVADGMNRSSVRDLYPTKELLESVFDCGNDDRLVREFLDLQHDAEAQLKGSGCRLFVTDVERWRGREVSAGDEVVGGCVAGVSFQQRKVKYSVFTHCQGEGVDNARSRSETWRLLAVSGRWYLAEL